MATGVGSGRGKAGLGLETVERVAAVLEPVADRALIGVNSIDCCWISAVGWTFVLGIEAPNVDVTGMVPETAVVSLDVGSPMVGGALFGIDTVDGS